MKLKTETENGFKQTEIGSIPEDWETVRMNEAYSFTKKPPRIDLSKYKRIPFIPMEFVPDDGKDLNRYEFREKVSSGTFVCKGDLIVAKITPSFENGKQAIVRDIPFDFVYATTEVWPIHGIEGQSDIDYLFYYLKKQDVRNDVAGKMEGSTGRQRVPKNVLENLTIPFPTLEEQQKIAFVLSKIQQAIEQQGKIIKKTKELKRSLMQKLFTEGLRGEELKETEIGLMPRSWEMGSFESLCVNIKDSWSPGQPINGIYIGLEHIKSGSSGLKHFGDPKNLRSSKSIFYEGDILYGKLRPYLDKAVITNKKGICSTDILVFRPKNDVPAGFIVNLIHWPPFIEYAKKTTHGVNHPRTSWNSIRNFICGIPQHEEQQEIANILWGIDNKIEHEIRSKGMLNELFKSMLQLLMTGQVRVKDIDSGEISV